MSGSASGRRWMTIVLASVLVAGLALGVRLLWFSEPGRPARGATAPATEREDLTPEVRGSVVDGEGRPVRGAAVRLLSPSAPWSVRSETTSDGKGRFSFPQVDPGRVIAVADHDPEGFATGAAIDVAPGATEEVRLTLSATSGVMGSVVDGQNRAVAGATVSVAGVPWRVPSATSDAAGAFRLVVVPDQATSVLAEARGYRKAQAALEHRQVGAELVVRLELGVAGPVQGDVRNADGAPVRARVIACSGQGAEVAAMSAEDGSFELPSMTIGCFAVAQMSGAAASAPTEVVEGAVLHLKLGAGGAIEGVVLDDRGSPVPAFSIGIESFVSAKSATAFGAYLQPRYDRGPRSYQDPQGAFRWDKLLPGDYVLTASVRGMPLARTGTIAVNSGVVTRGVRIVLVKGGSVSGRVTDAHGAPLADVDLAFDTVSSIEESTVSTRTDASGRYQLDGAPSGLFSLRAQKSGFRTRLLPGLRVASGSSVTEDITLTEGSGIENAGVGGKFSMSPEGIIFAFVGPTEPAARAGIVPGDRLVSIDGDSCDGMLIADAVQRLRGPAGTSVAVSVEHSATRQTVDLVIVRDNLLREGSGAR
jgi:Carboxypeptidase regulatory-like domain/PDZ domain